MPKEDVKRKQEILAIAQEAAADLITTAAQYILGRAGDEETRENLYTDIAGMLVCISGLNYAFKLDDERVKEEMREILEPAPVHGTA